MIDTQVIGLIDKDPDVQSLNTKLFELTSRRTISERRKAEIATQLSKRITSVERAAQLLADPADDMSSTRAALAEELGQLERDDVAIAEAINSARQRLRDVRGQVSLQICEALRPQYAQIASKMIDALRTLASINEEELRFVDQLQRHDIQIYFDRCYVPVLGTIDDPQSRVSQLLKELETNYPANGRKR